MIDLDELEKLAKGATPGKWEWKLDDDFNTNDWQFIGAASPQTILKIIAVVKACKEMGVHHYMHCDIMRVGGQGDCTCPREDLKLALEALEQK